MVAVPYAVGSVGELNFPTVSCLVLARQISLTFSLKKQCF